MDRPPPANGSRAVASKQIARSVATGLVLATAALTAGGIFCFPLYAPILVEKLSLTQAQVSTIALAGMSAQYPLAAVVGTLLDTYGTWLTAAMAGVFFASGFGGFAYQISSWRRSGRKNGLIDLVAPAANNESLFRNLVALFFLCGVGTASSLFTVMFSASQAFPGHTGISTGASTAFFGLSPLFLSVMASNFFSSKDGLQLDVTRFIFVLSIMAGIAHLLAATFLRIFPPKEMGSSISREDQDEDEEIENPVPVVHPTEHTPLLHDATPTPKPDIPIESHQTIGQLLSDADFWLLALTMLLLLGSCEMFMANVGTMVLGVPVNRDEATTGGGYSFGSMIRRLGGGVGGGGGGAAQVRLLSFSNTCARLFVGPLADYLAPAPLAHPHGGIHFPRKRYTTRILFLSVSCGLMVAAFCWMAAGVISQEDIYFVSIATGVAYGVTFTVTPSMVAAFWLGPSAGRNYGIVTYAPFIGTPIFSYLYAWISSSHQIDENTVCTGTRCWRTTFWITTVTSSVALILSLILARRRRDRI